MSIVDDQIRRLDAQLDRYQLGGISTIDEAQALDAQDAEPTVTTAKDDSKISKLKAVSITQETESLTDESSSFDHYQQQLAHGLSSRDDDCGMLCPKFNSPKSAHPRQKSRTSNG